MKYQLIAQKSIKLVVILLVSLLAWSSYHSVMATMHFDKMQMAMDSSAPPIPCVALCIIVTQMQWNDLLQALYASAVVISTAILFYVLFGGWIRRTSLHQWMSNFIHFLHVKIFLYVQKQRPIFKLFCPIIEQYQKGIVAPKLCE